MTTHAKPSIVIFDLDQTLYRQPAVQTFYDNLAAQLASASNEEFAREKAAVLGPSAMSGASNTLTLYLRYGISFRSWHEAANRAFSLPLLNCVEALPCLITTLSEMTALCRLLVWTNNTRAIAETILGHLGVRECFSRLYTLTDLVELNLPDAAIADLMKPSAQRAAEIVAECGASPSNILMVGDRYEMDLAPAEKVGMQIRLVQDPNDVCSAMCELFGLTKRCADRRESKVTST